MEEDKAAFSDVVFLDLKSVDKIKQLEGNAGYPVPVQMQNSPEDLKEVTIEAIAAGLIKVISKDPAYLRNVERFAAFGDEELEKLHGYYKSMLLMIHPNVETDLSLAGVAKTNAKDYAFAEQILSAVKNIGHSAQSYVNLAVLHANQSADLLKQKKRREADEADEKIAKVLHEGLRHNPGNPDILAELGGYHLRHQELEVASDFFQDSLKTMADGERKEQIKGLVADMQEQLDQENTVFAAYDQIMLGNEKKALEIIEGFLKLEPGSWEGWYVKGWALRCLERYGEAKDALLRSASRNPDIAATYNELAICERELGNPQLSKEYLEMAVEQEEDNVIYLANLAYLYLADKDFSKARYFLDKARLVDSSDNQVQDLIEEYEVLSGEKLGPAVEEILRSREEIQEIVHEEHEKGHDSAEI